MQKKKYHPEEYWSEVATRIASRDDEINVVAGDDEPYYRYKREEFLNLLLDIEYQNKSVLEIGCGPGGNLLEIIKENPSKLVGVDISDQMVKLAKNNVPPLVEIIKVNGTELPFNSRTFDIVFTATVLQHNTDESMLDQIIAELARVSSDKVFLFERIESRVVGDDLCLGRPIQYYKSKMETHGFQLISQKFIDIRTSYFISGAIRKGLNKSSRKEGEKLNKLSEILQSASLPITKRLDKIFTSEKDICRMEFQR